MLYREKALIELFDILNQQLKTNTQDLGHIRLAVWHYLDAHY